MGRNGRIALLIASHTKLYSPSYVLLLWLSYTHSKPGLGKTKYFV
jgi:hypothetical protein